MMATDEDEETQFVFPNRRDKRGIGNIYHADENPLGHARTKRGGRGEVYCGDCGMLIPPDGRTDPRKCLKCLAPSTYKHHTYKGNPQFKARPPEAKPAPVRAGALEVVVANPRDHVTESLFRKDPKTAFRILMAQASRAKTFSALYYVKGRLEYFLAELERAK